MKEKTSFGKAIKIVGKVLSWALFLILLVAAAFLIYYYVATKIYTAKGPGYEPKYSIYTIISGSMTPTIKVYDTIINERVDDANDIQVGDVITFVSTSLLTPGTTITHRVVGITEDSDGNTCFRTKGDYNGAEDQSCAKFQNVIGRVILKIPQLGRIQFFLASRAGWLLCILLPALYIIGRDIMRIFKLTSIKNTTEIISVKKKDPKKAKMEEERKKELKRKLLKEEVDNKDYYKEPEIKEIDKNNKKKK